MDSAEELTLYEQSRGCYITYGRCGLQRARDSILSTPEHSGSMKMPRDVKSAAQVR